MYVIYILWSSETLYSSPLPVQHSEGNLKLSMQIISEKKPASTLVCPPTFLFNFGFASVYFSFLLVYLKVFSKYILSRILFLSVRRVINSHYLSYYSDENRNPGNKIASDLFFDSVFASWGNSKAVMQFGII